MRGDCRRAPAAGRRILRRAPPTSKRRLAAPLGQGAEADEEEGDIADGAASDAIEEGAEAIDDGPEEDDASDADVDGVVDGVLVDGVDEVLLEVSGDGGLFLSQPPRASTEAAASATRVVFIMLVDSG
jgi:hypothetical protein